MVRAGVIDEASKIWWDVRPSAKFPTLEMRMTDVCTRIDDTVTIAAFYVCIISMLKRLKLNNQRWRIYPRILIDENRWLAQRHGTGNSMVDFGKGESVPFGELMEELIELVREDAERLDCVAEIDHARDIVARGTSAQRQLALFQEAQEQGADERQALEQVVDMLIEETAMGLDLPAADR
jgi:carboxylate-amine ligase